MENEAIDFQQLEFCIYECAAVELVTMLNTYNKEQYKNCNYDMIENIKYRIKKPESIINKLSAKNYALSYDSIIEHIHDIAGIRIICSFIPDIYSIVDYLLAQPEVELVLLKDYVKTPKKSGYRSVHLIIKTPIHFSAYQEQVVVEVQIRTMAMDFWATLEHKLSYKSVFSDKIDLLKEQLVNYAETVNALDTDISQMKETLTKEEC